MKRFLITAVIIILAVIGMLGQTILDPADYTGEWYSANGQCVYLFREGIIYCEKHSIPLFDGSAVSGAYTFSGKSIVLFAAGAEGLETTRELYLIEHKEEIYLCDNEEGTGEIFFIRSQQEK